jgi:HEAT repeat protein
LAYSLQFDRYAHEFSRHRRFRTQLIGVTTLGRLRDGNAWDTLTTLLIGDNSLLSLVAAHALLQIDPARALPGVFEQVRRHNDWPLAKVASMLAEVRSPAVAANLHDTLSQAQAHAVPRLLMLLTVAPVDDPWALLEPFLAADQPVPVLAAALKVCRDPRGLPSVRRLAHHESWVVRAQAGTVIGHLGDKSDVALLQELLGDREWWVRYRAARALTELPTVTRQSLAAACEQMGDRFAQQILRQVLAETEKVSA